MTNYIDKYYLNGTEYKIKFDLPGWEPGENTIAYIPFTQNLIDTISNSGPTTTRGTPSVSGGYCTFSSAALYYTLGSTINWGNAWTITQRINETGRSSYTARVAMPGNISFFIGITGTSTGSTPRFSAYDEGSSSWTASNGWEATMNTRNCWTTVWDGSSFTIYKNGIGAVQGAGKTVSGSSNQLYIGIDNSYDHFTGYVGQVIVENVVWTDKLAKLYYNQTKSLYGIS